MNNLEKIVLLNWYADENIDFVLKKNQKNLRKTERVTQIMIKFIKMNYADIKQFKV